METVRLVMVTHGDEDVLSKRISVARSADPREPAVIVALRVSEMVRILHMDALGKTDTSVEQEPDDSATESVDAPEHSNSFGIGLGLGGLFSTGGTGPFGTAGGYLFWSPIEQLSIQLDGSFDFASANLSTATAIATLDLTTFRLWFFWLPFGERLFSWAMGVGAGPSWVMSEGAPNDTYEVDDVITYATFVGVRSYLIWHMNRLLGLQLSLDGGTFLPSVKIRFDSEEVAEFGRFVFQVDGGLVLRFSL